MAAEINIAVYPPPDDSGVCRLLKSLAGAFAVRFDPILALDQLRHDAVLLLADNDATLLRTLASFPAVFSAPDHSGPLIAVSDQVIFSACERLSAPLRRESLDCSFQSQISTSVLPDYTVLASLGGQAVWLTGPTKVAPGHFRSQLPVARIAEGEELIDLLHEFAFISLLPLVDFISRLTNAEGWHRPPLRATMIIDDPNLHYRRYGHIDYEKFAQHARQTNFHACMATVPFDGWFINQKAVDIFRNNPDVLSLAVHGNDHEFKELACSIPDDGAERIIAQAMRRIAQIECKSGLSIAKVMVPPHGACSGTFLKIMAQTGFYGATTTRGVIWENSSPAKRMPGSGMALAEIVDGLPIVHRFRFNSKRWQHRIAISAYLKHPLIAYGHHDDFADGIEAFDRVAGRINFLGAKWVDPAKLFTSNFEFKEDGSILWIMPFSRHLLVPIDDKFSEVRFDLRNFPDWQTEMIQYTLDCSSEIHQFSMDGRPASTSITVKGSKFIKITLKPSKFIDYHNVNVKTTRFISIVRRIFSECRDRCVQPVF